MKSMLNKVSDCILVLNLNGNIVFCNDKLLSLLQYNDADLKNKNITKILYNENINIKLILKNKKNENEIIDFINKGGERKSFNIKISEGRFESEESLFMILNPIDIQNPTISELKNILDNIETILFIKDSDGKYVYGNQAFIKLTGKSKERIIGKDDKFVWGEGIKEFYTGTDKDVIKANKPKIYEEIIPKDTGYLWYEICKSPIYDNDKIKYIVGNGRDITLEKMVREELYKNYCKTITLNHRDYDIDKYMYDILNNICNNIMTSVEAQGVSVLLYDKEQKSLLPYIELGNSNKLLKKLEKTYISDDIRNILIKSCNKENDEISNWIEGINISYNETTGIYIIKLNDELIGVFGISYYKNIHRYNNDDLLKVMMIKIAMLIKNCRLSKELQMENKKRRIVEKELELYLDISVDLIAVINRDTSFKKANDNLFKLLGLEKDELLSKKYSDVIHKDDVKKIEKLMRKNNLSEDVEELTFKALCKDGNYILIESRIKYLREQDLFIVTGKDITKRKKFEDEKKKLEEAIHLESVKNEFFANISHEFKTPLNIILGTMQLINRNIEIDNINKDNLIKYMYTIKQNSYRLLRLVNNLIDISRIDIGYYNLQSSNQNIVNIIEEITLSVVEYVQGKKINLVFDTDCEEVILACDPDKIERVMLNLLSNAIKYTNNDGKIEVKLTHRDDKILVSVKDSGVGIPKDKLNLIFDRFGQANNVLTRRCEGSGIGLSLVKSIVEMHGGNIQVFSEVGVGTEFIFDIPIKVLKEENVIYEYDNKDYHIEKCNIEFSDIYSL